VSASWEAIVAQLGLIAMTGQLARNCAMTKLTASEIELSLPRSQEPMLGAHQSKLKTALQARFGGAFRVTFKVVSGEIATPAIAEKREQNERHAQAAAAIANDPFVRELQESFGGSVKKSSIQPLP